MRLFLLISVIAGGFIVLAVGTTVNKPEPKPPAYGRFNATILPQHVTTIKNCKGNYRIVIHGKGQQSTVISTRCEE